MARFGNLTLQQPSVASVRSLQLFAIVRDGIIQDAGGSSSVRLLSKSSARLIHAFLEPSLQIWKGSFVAIDIISTMYGRLYLVDVYCFKLFLRMRAT